MGRLNMDDVRASAKEIKASQKGGKFFKCQPGKNVIRLFPFESASQGRTRLERAILRHYKLDEENPLCQKTMAPDGRKQAECGFCTRVEEIRAEEGDKIAKRVEANKKFVVNVVPLVIGGVPVTELKMTLFDAPTSVIQAVLAVMEDSGDPGAFVGLDGLDLAINYDPKADPKGMYTAMFRAEAASKQSTVALKKVGKALDAKVEDLDANYRLLPDWYKEEQGIEDKADDKDGDSKPAKRVKPAVEAEATTEEPAVEEPAFDADAPATDEPVAVEETTEEVTTEEPVAEPTEEPAAEAEEPKDPVYSKALPRGVTAFWSEKRGKFYFKMPNGTTTWDEAEALAASGPGKPAPKNAPPPATAPRKNAAPVAAPKAAAKPVTSGKPAAAKAGAPKPKAKK